MRTINQNKIRKELMAKMGISLKDLRETLLYNCIDYLSSLEIAWDYDKISYDDICYCSKVSDSEVCNSYNWNSIIDAVIIFFTHNYRKYTLISFLIGGDPRCVSNYTSPMILPLGKSDFFNFENDFVAEKRSGNYIYRIYGCLREDTEMFFQNIADESDYGYLSDDNISEEHEKFLEKCRSDDFCGFKTNNS